MPSFTLSLVDFWPLSGICDVFRLVAGVPRTQTPSTGLRHPSLEEGAGK